MTAQPPHPADLLRRAITLCEAVADRIAPLPAIGHFAADPVEIANRLLRIRRRREAVLGKGLFADPAWDMLLDLFVAEAAGRRISVSSACLASAVPPTTALRHLVLLEARGLIERRPAKADGRRINVALSPSALAELSALLTDI
ncbi:hypothetical protein PQ455_07505 [Sphingomonas naphthae]|uniref:HTH marR-type domain-containing protein n=1 Tax=Sphingomonas naphthae TaxID=1813468 RepID=A0ABY7TP95_9SPHN|nr:hypothetical protein [Sphingomonas naphthae]WCT75052.1 hypothetical protein PQ455_07505 [Sphingomonas naphthae]